MNLLRLRFKGPHRRDPLKLHMETQTDQADILPDAELWLQQPNTELNLDKYIVDKKYR